MMWSVDKNKRISNTHLYDLLFDDMILYLAKQNQHNANI